MNYLNTMANKPKNPNYILRSFDENLARVMDEGYDMEDRTGVGCRYLPGITTTIDISERVPVPTLRATKWKAMLAEYLWFLTGSDRIGDLRGKFDSKVWDAWEKPEWAKSKGLPEDSIGYGYGPNLIHYGATLNSLNNRQLIKSRPELNNYFGFNQVDHVINLLKTNPNSRRILFSFFRPDKQGPENTVLDPCFPGGQKVLTPSGAKNIEDLNIGDYVFDDIGNINKISQCMNREYNDDLLELDIRYSPKIRCTKNHPIFVKDKGWTDAKNIVKNDYVKIECQKSKQEVPIFTYIRNYGNNNFKEQKFTISEDDAWTLGYFLGDGWVEDNSKKICFSIAFKNFDNIFNKIRKTIKISNPKSKHNTSGKSKRCHTFNNKWFFVFSQFGKYSHGKYIPDWIYNLPNSYIEKFIEGYMCADGGVISANNNNAATTVSPSIALGIQRLSLIIGKKCSVKLKENSPDWNIEGRSGESRPLYSIVFRGNRNNSDVLIENNTMWLKVLNVKQIKGNCKVYNIEVENSHTYNINNVSVHNCHLIYQFIPEPNNKLSCVVYQRSSDSFVGNLSTNLQGAAFYTYMICQQTGFLPSKLIHTSGHFHIYHNHFPFVEEYLKRPEVNSPILNLNKKDCIYDYTLDDFELTDYNPLEKMRIPIAV